jgi:predicted MFS family arabinose efflux permease
LIAALLLDVAVSTNLVLGQRTLYALGAEVRGRLNALYMACFFGGGALGSALAGWAWTQGGWPRVCLCGMVFLSPALALFVTELRPAATRLNPSSANPRQ